MTISTTNPFLQFQALGYSRFVPILPPDADISENSSLYRALNTKADPRGKAVGVKGRNGKWHGFDWFPYESDDEDLLRWHRMGAGVGIKTGDGLILVDADTSNPQFAQIIHDDLAKIVPNPPVRIGNKPKAGYLLKTDKDFQYTRIEFGERNEKGNLTERVEILSNGRQFVAHGIHPRTGKPYTWPRQIPNFADIPYITPQQITQIMETLRTKLPAASPIIREGGNHDVNQEALKGDPAAIRKAVAATPNTSAIFPSRESYVGYGYAIKAALPDNEQEAFEIYSDWCERWQDGDNTPDVIASDWRRMKPPYKRGAGFIYDIAETHSNGQFKVADLWFSDLGEETENPFEVAEKRDHAQHKAEKFKFLSIAEAADRASEQSTKPLIKGLLDQGTLSVMYGDSNVGKTFVAMDMAYHVASGMTYSDMRTTQGLVVYVAAEGGVGALRRTAALREKYQDTFNTAEFQLLASPVDLRRPDADMPAFLAALSGLGKRISLIVIDTLSRALAGGDENSSVDMGAIVKHFDTIRAATGAHVMVVHHTGKNKANGARGHSLLRAATDTEIEVEEGQIRVTKQRDLDKSWASGFALEVRTLGVDVDGDAVTSCTVRLVSASEAAAAAALAAGVGAGGAEMRIAPTAVEGRVLDCLHDLLEDVSGEGTGVTVEQLLAGSREALAGMTTETLRSHLRVLKEKGHVVRPKRGFWAFKTVEDASTVSETKQFYRSETVENGRETVGNIFA